MQKLSNQISDLRELEKLSTNLCKDISVGDIYLFQGELGAGKTTFVRFCLEALGWQGKVKSPTFGLIEEYHVQSIKLIHTDLYRLNSADEFE